MEEQMIKRILPHSTEAEQSVIGAMLLDQEAIITASEWRKISIILNSKHCIMP